MCYLAAESQISGSKGWDLKKKKERKKVVMLDMFKEMSSLLQQAVALVVRVTAGKLKRNNITAVTESEEIQP